MGGPRRDPLLLVLVVLAAVATVLPLWVGRYVPLLDYPNHLSWIFLWQRLHDPAWGFAEHYTTNYAPLPYWIQYGSEYLMAQLIGADQAQRLFTALCLLGLPAALALYARRMGRDPRLGLLAFPLGWNMNLANGFLSFVGGLPVLLVALAALDRHAEQPSWRGGLGATLLGVVLYFSHPLVWGAFLWIGGVTALYGAIVAAPPGRWPARAVLGPLPTVPTLLIGLAAYRYGDTSTANLRVRGGLAAYEGAFNDILSNLGMLPTWLNDIVPSGGDELLALLGWLCWLLLLSSAAFARPAPAPLPTLSGRRADLYALRAELALLAALVLYMVLPRSLLRPFYWFAINRRLAVLVALLLLPLCRGRLTGLRRLPLYAAGVLAIAFGLNVSAHFYRFNQRARGFDVVMADVPRGARVLPLIFTRGDEDVNVHCYNQWGSHVQMRVGGYMVQYFPIEFPIRYRGPARRPAPAWDAAERFQFEQHGPHWDYFLVHGPSKIDPFAGYHARVRLLKQSGDWQLWGKVTP